jgi:hypothetical protein
MKFDFSWKSSRLFLIDVPVSFDYMFGQIRIRSPRPLVVEADCPQGRNWEISLGLSIIFLSSRLFRHLFLLGFRVTYLSKLLTFSSSQKQRSSIILIRDQSKVILCK